MTEVETKMDIVSAIFVIRLNGESEDWQYSNF